MFENWINNKVKNYLENNIETILNNISDETIRMYFDKVKNSVIEARHLKEEVLALKKENDELRNRLITLEINERQK
jgi:hypothetical protein